MGAEATGLRPELRVAVAGDGAVAERWSAALRNVAGVDIVRLPEALDAGLFAALTEPQVCGIVFAAPLAGLPTAIKRAIVARRHVFVAAPVALGASQLAAMDHLARWRRRVLLFDTPDLGDDAFAFVRRLTAGPQPLWRTRYVRGIRTACPDGLSIDELALHELARLVRLLGTPLRVSAVNCGADEGAGAALLTLAFARDVIARLDVSLVETEPRQELTVVCDGRTFFFDGYDVRAPLKVTSPAHRSQHPSGDWVATTSEHPWPAGADRVSRAAQAFVAGVRAEDPSTTNAAEVALAAEAWEAARESMTRAGEWTATGGARAQSKRPVLQVIEGGGRRVAGHPAPLLALVRPGRFRPVADDAPTPA